MSIEELEEEVSRLRERIDALEDALRPFAEFAFEPTVIISTRYALQVMNARAALRRPGCQPQSKEEE